MAVRTVQLGQGSLIAGGRDDLGKVPAGYTCIIKALNVQGSASSSSTPVSLILTGPAGLATVIGRATLAANAVVQVNLWVVALPGDQLEVLNGGPGPANYVVSGTLMPGLGPALV